MNLKPISLAPKPNQVLEDSRSRTDDAMGRGEDGDDRGEEEDEDDRGDIEAIEMEEDLVEQIEYAICRMYETHGETFLPLLEEVGIIEIQG